MSKPVRILDFKVTPHGQNEYVLRLFLPGDVHVDFTILPDALEELGREASNAGTVNLRIGSSSNANREIGGPGEEAQ